MRRRAAALASTGLPGGAGEERKGSKENSDVRPRTAPRTSSQEAGGASGAVTLGGRRPPKEPGGAGGAVALGGRRLSQDRARSPDGGASPAPALVSTGLPGAAWSGAATRSAMKDRRSQSKETPPEDSRRPSKDGALEGRRPSKDSVGDGGSRQPSKMSSPPPRTLSKEITSDSRRPSNENPSERKPSKTSTGAMMQPAADHPQHLRIWEEMAVKPAASLELWFDSGLVRGFGEDEAVHGRRPLPVEYDGCDEDTILVVAARSGVKIWPVRLDFGPMQIERETPCTLYHYTYKEAFEKFVEIFGQMATEVRVDSATQKLLAQLRRDYRERQPNPTKQNPRGDPELLLVEPGRFGSKDEVLKAMFGMSPCGFSRDRHAFSTFVDFCVVVRVPAGACFPLGAETGSAALPSSRVRLCAATLEALERRAALFHQATRARVEREAKEEQRDDGTPKRTGCLGFLCGGGRKRLEYWDEAKVEDADVPTGGAFTFFGGGVDERCDRGKRGGGEAKRNRAALAKRWVREHFIKVEQQGETLARRKVAEQRAEDDFDAAERRRMGADVEEPAQQQTVQKNQGTNSCKIRLASENAKQTRSQSKDATEEGSAPKVRPGEPGSLAAQLYEKHKQQAERPDAEKPTGRAALNRMKFRRAVQAATLLRGVASDAMPAMRSAAGGLPSAGDGGGGGGPPPRTGSAPDLASAGQVRM